MNDRQKEIINAAGMLLAEEGSSGLTTKNLAAKVGFSEAALYRHFHSREEIILAMLEYLQQEVDRELSVIDKQKTDAVQKLLQVFARHSRFLQRNRQFVSAIFAENLQHESPAINSAVLKLMETRHNYLLHFINEGCKEGLITTAIPAADIVHMLMGSFRLLVLKWKLGGFRFSLPGRASRLFENLIQLITLK